MPFNLIDILLAVYIGWGAWRGRRRGLTDEASRVILLLLAILTGYSLVRWIGRILHEWSKVTGQLAGPIGALGIMIGAYLLARHLRQRLRDTFAVRFPDPATQQHGGTMAGATRTLIIGSTIIVFIGLMPLGPIAKPFSSGSITGRILIRAIVPAYHHLAGNQQLPNTQTPPSVPDPVSTNRPAAPRTNFTHTPTVR
jgi:uncharacterized membrane protein required for colicin V production